MKIVKTYKITEWCQYQEIAEIGDTSNFVLQPNYGGISTTGGHICNYQTWLDDATGDGFEIRTFTVKA